MDLLTNALLRSFRFRFCVFLVRMWFASEWPRFTRPFEVSLKRFFAPRWDLSFGTTLPTWHPLAHKTRPHHRSNY